ncbi:MAG: hypothetical protein RL095_1319 [Verrucomicrobiota bacterium]|jgi:hypothetical protein
MIAACLLLAASPEFPPDPPPPAHDASPLPTAEAAEDRRPRFSLGPGLFPADPGPGLNLWGNRNLVRPSAAVWGELRSASAWSRQGGTKPGLTLAGDIQADWKLTPSERFHARFLPGLDADARRSLAWGAEDAPHAPDLHPESLYFETDLGTMSSSLSGQPADFESRLALGLVPLRLGQGLWIDDAIIGGVCSSPWPLPGCDGNDSGSVIFAGSGEAWAPRQDDSAEALMGLQQFADSDLGRFEWGLAGLRAEREHEFSPMLGWNGRFGLWSSGITGTAVKGQSHDGFALLARNRLDLDGFSPYLNGFCGDQESPLLRDRRRPGLFREAGICFAFDPLAPRPVLEAGRGLARGAAAGMAWKLCPRQELTLEVATVTADSQRGGAAALRHSWQLRNDIEVASTVIHRIQDDQAPASGLSLELTWQF